MSKKCHQEIVKVFLEGKEKRINPRYQTLGRALFVWGNKVAEGIDNSIVLYDCGYQTMLTKNVLNEVLYQTRNTHRIFQEKGTWYLHDTKNGSNYFWKTGYIIPWCYFVRKAN